MGEIILLQKFANQLLFWYWIFVNNSLRTYTKVFKWTWTSQFFSLALCKSLLFFHICKELWPFKQLVYISFYWALIGFCFLNLSQSHLIGKIPKKARNMILLESLDLWINNHFGEISCGIFGFSFVGYFIHELSFNSFLRTIQSCTLAPYLRVLIHLATLPILNSMELLFPKMLKRNWKKWGWL